MTGRRRTGWVGGRTELDRLDEALGAVGAAGLLVLVRGPAGSGRSTAVDAAARAWRAHGVTVLAPRFGGPGGRADAYGFDPLLAVLREDFERLDAPSLAGPLAALSGACVLPSDRTVERAVALAAVFNLLGTRNRTALVVDDADLATFPALALTAARRPRCLVVASCRTDDSAAAGQLAAAADVVVDLPPLADDDIDALLQRGYGAPVDAALATALRNALGPLSVRPGAVLSTVDALCTEGRVGVVRGRLCLTGPGEPIALPTEHDLVGRTRRRGDVAVRLTTTAATIPLSLANLPLLADATGVEADRYGQELDRLVADGVLVTGADGAVRPYCPALGARLLADAGPTAVARLHRAFAAALLRRAGNGGPVDPSRIARHVVSAGSAMPVDESTVGWLGDQAVTVAETDPVLAVAWLRGALPLAPATPVAVRIGLPVIRRLIRTGRYRLLADTVPAIVDADDRSPALTPADRAELASAALLAALHIGEPAAARVRSAGRADPALDDLYRLWFASRPAAGPSAAGATPAAAPLRRVARAFRTRDGHGPAPAGHLGDDGTDDLLAVGSLGDLDMALRLVEDDPPIADAGTAGNGRTADGSLRAYHRLLQRYATGRLGDALSAGREVEVTGSPAGLTVQLARMVAAELHGLGSDLRSAHACLQAVPDRAEYAALRAWVDCGLADEDRTAQAARAGWRAYGRQRRTGSRIGVEQLLPRLAQLAVHTGQRDLAACVLTESERLRLGPEPALTVASALLVRALVSDHPPAAHRALVLPGLAGHRVARAQALLALGLVAADSEPWLMPAYQLVRSIDGAPRLRARVAAAMRERGLGVPRSRVPRDGLSEVDRQIVALLRHGRTNRQIALRLRMSEKTVENHLTRIFARTGHRSRVELAAASLAGALMDEAS